MTGAGLAGVQADRRYPVSHERLPAETLAEPIQTDVTDAEMQARAEA